MPDSKQPIIASKQAVHQAVQLIKDGIAASDDDRAFQAVLMIEDYGRQVDGDREKLYYSLGIMEALINGKEESRTNYHCGTGE